MQSASGGLSGVAWGVATAIADPITLPLWFVAPTKILQGASVAKTAAVVAGYAATDALVSDMPEKEEKAPPAHAH